MGISKRKHFESPKDRLSGLNTGLIKTHTNDTIDTISNNTVNQLATTFKHSFLFILHIYFMLLSNLLFLDATDRVPVRSAVAVEHAHAAAAEALAIRAGTTRPRTPIVAVAATNVG